jgi:type VI protein secretion system component VasK
VRSKKEDEFNRPFDFKENISNDSLLDQKTLEALGQAAKNVAEQLHAGQREESDINEQPTTKPPSSPKKSFDAEFEEEMDIEAFFSDEDDKGFQAVEDLQSVIKRVTKKTANMIAAINEC